MPPRPRPWPITPHRLRLARALSTAIALSTSGVLPAMLLGALAVQISADLGLRDATVGLVFAIYFAVAAPASFAGGRLTDRIGWRLTLYLASGLSCIACLGVAVSSTSFATLLPWAVIGGVTQGIAGPAGSLIVSQELPRTRQGLAFGTMQAAIPIATLLGGLAVPGIALTVGWRWAFVAAIAFPVIAVLIAPPGARLTRRPLRTAATSPRTPASAGLWFVTGGAALSAVGNVSLSAFLVLSSVAIGVAEGSAGLIAAAGSAAGLVMRIVCGWLIDRHHGAGLHAAALLAVVGSGGILLLALGMPPLVLPGALLGFGAGWGWSGLLLSGVAHYHVAAPASAIGTLQMGLSGGAAAGPLVFGAVADLTSYNHAWFLAFLLAFGGGLLVLVGGRRLRAEHPVTEGQPAA